MRSRPEPRLVVDGAHTNPRSGLIIRRPGPQTLGRGAECDLRINNPYLGRRHALLRYAGDRIVIEDLGSKAGTRVNGFPISQATVLRHGDRVTLGPVDMELEIPGAAALPAVAYPDEQSGSAANFAIAGQHARLISNVGRDQHNSYEYRYALQIAPMLDRARRLLRWGVALTLAATAIWLAIAVLFGREIVDWNQALVEGVRTGAEPSLPEISFAPLLAVLIAFVLGFAGFVMAAVAVMTRRRAHKEKQTS